MKILIVVLSLFLSSEKIYSQNNDINIELSHNVVDFILEPISKFTQLNNQYAFLIGLKLDWVLLNKIEIGLKINSLQNSISPLEFKSSLPSPEMKLVYGGIEPGYKFSLSKLFSIYPSLFVGYGYTNYNHKSGRFYGKYFWVVEPNIGLGYKFIDWLEFELGANYRKVYNVDNIHYSTVVTGFSSGEWDVPIELNNINLEIGLRFQL